MLWLTNIGYFSAIEFFAGFVIVFWSLSFFISVYRFTAYACLRFVICVFHESSSTLETQKQFNSTAVLNTAFPIYALYAT